MYNEKSALRSFIHGIINLIWPIFAYDLAELASYILWGYSWVVTIPPVIMLLLPLISCVVGIVIAGFRYYRKQELLTMMGLIFDVAGIALYYILRVVLNFSLGVF